MEFITRCLYTVTINIQIFVIFFKSSWTFGWVILEDFKLDFIDLRNFIPNIVDEL